MDDFRKIFLPLIRKAMPSMIAHDLCAVQPLGPWSQETGEIYIIDHADCIEHFWIRLAGGGDTGQIFTLRYGHSTTIPVVDTPETPESWCENVYGPQNPTNSTHGGSWFFAQNRYYFRDADARTMFMLRWAHV